MSVPASAREQSTDEIYRLVCAAAVQHRPITTLHDGTRRFFCPHVLGYNRPGDWRVFCYQYGGETKGGPLPVSGEGVPVQREEERSRSPLMSIPPLRGGDFQGIRVYRSDVFLGRARKANFRAQQHRLDEPTKLSLGMVASLQSPLLFRLARSL